MKNRVLIILFIITIVITGCSKEAGKSEKLENYALAIMVENDKGKYERYNGDTWPTDLYVFSKSECDNGASVIWNDKDKTVFLETNKSSKCTIYFAQMTIADYIKSLYTEDGVNNLY